MLKKHFVSFLDLKELSSKYGLGDFEIKIYRMAGKWTTSISQQMNSENWSFQALVLDGTGNEMNSVCF